MRIGELLVEAGVLTREQLDQALDRQREESRKLGQVLTDLGFVNETQLTQTLSNQLSVPWVSLYHIEFSRELLNLVPKDVAEQYGLVPIFVRRVRRQGETLYVAMDDPTQEGALAAVKTASGLPTKPMIACPSDIRSAIRAYYGPPPGGPLGSVRPPSASGDHPDADPEIEAFEFVPKSRSSMAPPMVAVTLLDGTTINLPARRSERPSAIPPGLVGGPSDQLTARDLVTALQAAVQGADASAVLGDPRQWESLFAALLAVLLRKGLVADWEFVEEFRKLTGFPRQE